jgi:hypothetical protein
MFCFVVTRANEDQAGSLAQFGKALLELMAIRLHLKVLVGYETSLYIFVFCSIVHLANVISSLFVLGRIQNATSIAMKSIVLF